jgi:uncharacterized integral membrane protein (TIGR00698 family)
VWELGTLLILPEDLSVTSQSWKKILFCGLLLACFLPAVSTAYALLAGILFSLLLGNPFAGKTSYWSRMLLQISVVGLGFGQSLGAVWQVGKDSVLYTLVGICLTLLAGMLIGRYCGIARNTSLLISFGTAICGGSAIAALSPAIKARDDETALALATVFALNAVALLLFPFVGELLHLSQHQFGIWAGLAIHDTSSVVGAASAYGAEALAVGTTVKLSRALWILPFVFGAAWFFKSDQKVKLPIFIVGFVVTAALRTLLPQFTEVWQGLAGASRQLLVVTLFLVGSGLSKEVLQRVGARPLAQGVGLWFLSGGITLWALLSGVIG